MNFPDTEVSLDSLMCQGVGSMASFRNYVDTLNCVLVSQCQKNGISRLGRVGRNLKKILKNIFY